MKRIVRSIFMLAMTVTGVAVVAGCYRMPDEGEWSVVPTTNNPCVIGEKTPGGWTPGGSF